MSIELYTVMEELRGVKKNFPMFVTLKQVLIDVN